MTHPASVRQEALVRLTAGESALSIGKLLGIEASTVIRWGKTATEEIPNIAKPVRERMRDDFYRASVMCCERTLALLPMQDSVRDTAYACKVMVEAGAAVDPDAVKDQGGGVQILQQFATLSADDLRKLANS